MTRVLDAPRRLVFDASARPELVRQWLLGPPRWTMPVCEIDLRAGGAYRYVWRRSTGAEMGMGGETTLTLTMRYESRETRDAVLKTPMEQGVGASYDRLAELLALPADRAMETQP